MNAYIHRLAFPGTAFMFDQKSSNEVFIELPFEPLREKNNNLGFRQGLIQTSLYSHRQELEGWKLGYK